MRNQVTQYYSMSSQLKGLSMKMSTMASYQEIVKSMGSSTKVLTMMNEKMDVKEIQNVLKEFTKESMKADMNQEMV